MAAPIDLLQQSLRDLIETERVALVEFYAAKFRTGVARFLEHRQPNQTIHDVYREEIQTPLGIREATDHDDAFAALGNDRYLPVLRRPPFVVQLRPDADAILHAIAERQVEGLIQTFITRATEKLGPVVERRPSFDTIKIAGDFRRGLWTGRIKFNFSNGLEFTAELKIVANVSKYGRPFAQYPMTFYNAFLHPHLHDTVVFEKKTASIEEIWAAVGYVPATPAPKPRWTKLVSGSVVRIEGRCVLVGTPKQAKTLGIPDDAEQIARIDVFHRSYSVEYADGRRDRRSFTDTEMFEINGIEDGSYSKAQARRRCIAFAHFFPH
jgi:hypothetical protein